jgi:uncharacterized protein involved in exopolysaccharide biosynthesis
MNQTHYEEIDLVELLAKSIRALRRHAILISICLGLTLGLAVWIWVTSDRVYESRMMIYSSILTQSYCEQLAENLNALVRDRNRPALASRLGLTEEQAAAIRKVEMEGALEGAVPEPDRWAIVVTVRITDNAILPDLQKGIIEYIAGNDFVKVRTDERKRTYEELIARVAEEIEKLEAVKQRLLEGAYTSPQGMVMMNPSEAYSRTVSLVKEKLELEEKLRLVNSVQLVEGFIPLNNPVSPRLSLLLVGGFVAGILLFFLIIGLRYVWYLAERDVPTRAG